MLTRIAVLVSGGGTNLEQILLAAEAGEIPYGKIALVVSDHADAYALTRAANHGVAHAVVEDAAPAAFEQKVQQLLQQNNIDMVVLAGFMRILSADFVARWPERMINVHPSLIPSFCGKGFYGLKVHQAALDYGVKISGATVHIVNEIPDGGRILLQKAVAVLPTDDAKSLQRRIMEEAEWQLLPQATAELAKELYLAKKNFA